MNAIKLIKRIETLAIERHPTDKAERFSYENRLLREHIVGLQALFDRYQSPVQTIEIDLHGVKLDVAYTYVPADKESPASPLFADFASITAVYAHGKDIFCLLSEKDKDILVSRVLGRLNK